MILFLPLIFSKIASMMYLLLSSLLSAGTYLSKKSWHLLAESIGHFLLRQFHILWLCGFPVLEALSSLLSVFFLPVYFQNSFSLFFFLSWKSWSLVNLFSPDNLIHTHDFDSEPYVEDSHIYSKIQKSPLLWLLYAPPCPLSSVFLLGLWGCVNHGQNV